MSELTKTWLYKTVVTQPNAGATTCGIDISFNMGSRYKIMQPTFGPDDYAADRDIDVETIDEDGKVVSRLSRKAAVDNLSVFAGQRVMADDSDASFNAIGLNSQQIWTEPDQLRFSAALLAQNETLTCIVRINYAGKKPTVVTHGANATMVVGYDKVR